MPLPAFFSRSSCSTTCSSVSPTLREGANRLFLLPCFAPITEGVTGESPHVDQPHLPSLRVEPSCLFQVLALYWRSPEFGDLWCKSRQLKQTICCPGKNRTGAVERIWHRSGSRSQILDFFSRSSCSTTCSSLSHTLRERARERERERECVCV